MRKLTAEIAQNIERNLEEQQLLREAIEHPGVKLLFEKLHQVRDKQAGQQLLLDPYSQQSEIRRIQDFRWVVDEFFPQVMETLINYEPEAPDRMVAPRRRWKIIDFISTAVNRQKVSKQ